MRVYFGITMFISMAVTIGYIFFIRKNTDKPSIWMRRLLLASFVTELSNFTIALHLSLSFNRAYAAYSLYFASIDWVLFFFLCFAVDYTTDLNVKKKIKLAPLFILCIADTASLLLNFFTKHAFRLYLQRYVDGDWYFHFSEYLPYKLHLALSYVLLLITIMVLGHHIIKAPGIYKKRYSVPLAVILGIVALNAFYLLFKMPLDWSVLLYIVAGIMVHYFTRSYIPEKLLTRTLKQTTDEFSEGLMIFDKEGVCIYANNFLQKLFKKKYIDFKFTESPISDWMYGRDLSHVDEFEGEHSTVCDGEEVRYRARFKSIKDSRDHYLGCYFIVDDTTRQYKAMQALKTAKESAEKAREEARRASSAKGDFLANMSHEIRTPINAILGMNEMILREDLPKEVREYANNIAISGESLLSIVNDILDFSKIESGKMELVPVTYEPFSIIKSCEAVIMTKLMEKSLHLEIECDTSCPRLLKGDDVRIKQVLLNFLSNAVKYTAVGTVTVKLGWKSLPEGVGELILSVTDTGIGIKKENIEKLFEAFKRVDEKKNRNIEGTGLGLSISSRLVELMNGEITVESEYGKGSTFTAIIPQIVVDPSHAGEYESSKLVTRHEYKELFKAPDAKILVVDDYKMNLTVIKGLLKKTEVKLTLVQSGKEAVEAARKEKFDLILMDHMMPEMDGIEAHRLICEGDNPNKATPMIMLTANALSDAEEGYMHEGFQGYLSKPVDSKKLEKLLYAFIPSEKVIHQAD